MNGNPMPQYQIPQMPWPENWSVGPQVNQFTQQFMQAYHAERARQDALKQQAIENQRKAQALEIERASNEALNQWRKSQVEEQDLRHSIDLRKLFEENARKEGMPLLEKVMAPTGTATRPGAAPVEGVPELAGPPTPETPTSAEVPQATIPGIRQAGIAPETKKVTDVAMSGLQEQERARQQAADTARAEALARGDIITSPIDINVNGQVIPKGSQIHRAVFDTLTKPRTEASFHDVLDSKTGKPARVTTEQESAEPGRFIPLRQTAAGSTEPQPVTILKPDQRGFKMAQDLAYGGLTFAQMRTMLSFDRRIDRQAVYDTAAQLNPNFNPAQFELGYKVASNPKIRQQVAAQDNVLARTDDLLKMSDQAKRSNVPALNAVIVKGGVKLGGKTYANFHAAQIAFADELSGALGFGSATDMNRQMGVDITDGTLSPDQFSSVINDVVVPFIKQKRQSLVAQMGTYGEDVNKMSANSGAPVEPKAGDKKTVNGKSMVYYVGPEGSGWVADGGK